ncbi:MAG: glycosyltransferase [Edaphobacter sp.]|uniref:glycosyltransferase n=1 Tax=Edaphobacter sp. TaxID=1934404 RepID=UPI0023A436E2|nr:glycosyltransferase [Edaphobacter sp.]MDE1176975.1 glycosyltransferase [Edaphobacter sp.]
MATEAPGRVEGGARLTETPQGHPLLSIIIVVFCDKDDLQDILESIMPHKIQDLEIVVIDGGSRDGTVALLQSFGSRIDYWLSEPDSGIYNAMNKGLQFARGQYILHLNAGDRLLMVPWQELRKCAASRVDVICCRVLLDNSIQFISTTGVLSKIVNTWHHQGTFYRRTSHLGYNETYKVFGDFDLNQRLLKSGCIIANFDHVVANHNSDGLTAHITDNRETYKIVRKNFGWPYILPARLRFRFLQLRSYLRQKAAPKS